MISNLRDRRKLKVTKLRGWGKFMRKGLKLLNIKSEKRAVVIKKKRTRGMVVIKKI